MSPDRALSASRLLERPPTSRRTHAIALAALALAAALRFHAPLASAAERPDERVYLQAFRAMAAGVSPYLPATDGLDFFYPPTFAALGGGALRLADERVVVLALRAANLLGLAACLWLSCLLAPLPRRWCLAAAIAYVLLAPPALQHGFGSGNFSFAAVGAALVALAAWHRAPLVAGLLLAFASVTKPLAPVGLALLALHRPRAGGRSHLAAAGAALALAGALALATPFLADYLALPSDPDAWPLRRSISLFRWLHLTGLPATPLAALGLVALVALTLARRSALAVRQLFVLAIAAMTFAAPALWSHTLLLTLPLQVLAVGRALTRPLGGSGGALVRFELPLVSLAVLSLQLADGIGGGMESAPAPIALLVLSVPLAAVLALAAYAWPASDSELGAGRPA